MGSASREALAKVRGLLDSGAATGTGGELLAAAAQIHSAPALLAALSDIAAQGSAKIGLIERVFAQLGADAKRVLSAAVSENWSNPDELIDGIEELGLRAEALVNDALADELLAAAGVIDSNHELELALGDKLSEPAAKSNLVNTLFTGKLSEPAVGIASYFAAHPRGRRVGVSLRNSARIVADQGGSELATVTVAQQLNADQQSRLAALLEQTAGRPVRITTVIEPELIGGVRVQIGDSVIDGSIRSRLEDLRLQLAG